MTTSTPTKVSLTVPRGDAFAKLSSHIGTGKELLQDAVTNDTQLAAAKRKYGKWHSYAATLLKQIFSDDSIADELEHGYVITPNQPLSEKIVDYLNDLETDIAALESIEERLPLFSEPSLIKTKPSKAGSTKRKSSGLTTESKTWQLIMAIIAILGLLLVAYLSHKFHWA